MDYSSFQIGFDLRDTRRVLSYWDEILHGQRWTEGEYTQRYEEKWGDWNGLPSVAMSSWTGGAMACMDFFNLKGKKVLCPTNTFMATPLAVVKAGAEIVFADCNRHDLCLSYGSMIEVADHQDVAAVWLVHIGGHIAFDTPKIAEYCRSKGIILLEDCAHAHGASWHGQKPGMWGDAGVYSFYATKSITTGEGGMLVSRHQDLIDFAKQYRNYGKFEYSVEGLNYRISEFTAALGIVQTERMEEIVSWKNEIAEKHLHPQFSNRVILPDGMVSGYYKYIVFDPIDHSTGKVYDQLCHTTMKRPGSFPNAEWITHNHWCVPLYYHPTAD